MSDGGAVLGVMCVFVIFFIVLEVFILWFWIWTLVDCVKNEKGDENTRIMWIIIVAATGVIGALIYYLVRRPQRISEADMRGFERVTVKDERYGGEAPHGTDREWKDSYVPPARNLCPVCGITLDTGEVPLVCPYCGSNLAGR